MVCQFSATTNFQLDLYEGRLPEEVVKAHAKLEIATPSDSIHRALRGMLQLLHRR